MNIARVFRLAHICCAVGCRMPLATFRVRAAGAVAFATHCNQKSRLCPGIMARKSREPDNQLVHSVHWDHWSRRERKRSENGVSAKSPFVHFPNVDLVAQQSSNSFATQLLARSLGSGEREQHGPQGGEQIGPGHVDFHVKLSASQPHAAIAGRQPRLHLRVQQHRTRQRAAKGRQPVSPKPGQLLAVGRQSEIDLCSERENNCEATRERRTLLLGLP